MNGISIVDNEIQFNVDELRSDVNEHWFATKIIFNNNDDNNDNNDNTLRPRSTLS